MTPTLFGRWQTRTILLLFLGPLVTWAVGFPAAWQGLISIDDLTLFHVLLMVWLLGLMWDVFYQWTLQFRWDWDWPPSLQLAAGVWEWLVVWFLLWVRWFDFLPEVGSWGVFHFHYWMVWLTVFTASQSLLRILSPRWRFRGGQFGGY